MIGSEQEMMGLLAPGETLTVEFKSDLKRLPDRDLIATVVALANTDGGIVLVGVEDDGTVTGAHPDHQDPSGLAALVANRTNLLLWWEQSCLRCRVTAFWGFGCRKRGQLSQLQTVCWYVDGC